MRKGDDFYTFIRTLQTVSVYTSQFMRFISLSVTFAQHILVIFMSSHQGLFAFFRRESSNSRLRSFAERS